MGLTGALPEVAESLPDLKDLCDKISLLEKMIQHAMAKVNELETKMETAEEEFGLVDNANKIKNLLAPMFVCIFIILLSCFIWMLISYTFIQLIFFFQKKGNISRQSAVPQEEVRDFVVDDYFVDNTSD